MIIIFALLGMVLASFYMVVGLRIPNNESIIKPASHCDNCKKKLNWYELIPVVSYIIQGGKCRGCKSKISIFSPILEIVSACLFALGYYLYGLSYELYAYLIIVSLLEIIFVSDFKYLVILDGPLFISIILIVVLKFIYFGFVPGLKSILAGLLFFIFLVTVKFCGDKFFKRESLGWGDVKLVIFIGVVLGIKLGLIALVIGSFVALPYAVYYIIKKQEKEIPYGPFLILGVYIVFIFMDYISEFINILLLIGE